MTRSERVASKQGKLQRFAWLRKSLSFPDVREWDQSEDWSEWASELIIGVVDAESFEEDGCGFGDLLDAFKAGFFAY
jgi:hypothetical protein